MSGRWWTHATSRGVDRVPERLRVKKPRPQWIHQHPPAIKVGEPGIWRKPGNCVPYTNPDRDAKSLRSGRLRKELRP